jgi:electron transport complex protein RnfG
MEKLQSSLQNMVLSLVVICMVAAGALAGVYTLTKANIAAQEKAKQQAAILAVLPEGCTVGEAEEVEGVTIYKATKGSEWVATAIETSEVGFDGPQVIMVGLDTEGKVINYEILKQTETPGLGAHITHWFKNAAKPGQNIIGRKAGSLRVNKDGGEIDAITAATISSRAFLKAINKAYLAIATEEPVDAATSASQQQSKEMEVSHE